jgi:hypothetical protein
MTDRLSLANALADAKIDRPAAERIATEIFDAIHDNVATKGDLQAARTDLKADIAAVRTELKADIAAVTGDLREVELRLEARIDRVVVRLGSLVVVVAGLLFVALRYLPPPH